MIKLTQFRQNLAGDFIAESARPLEKQLHAHYFHGAAVDAPLGELSAYQNADGGFGNGLEPDIRAECSSAYVTGEALRALRELKVPDTHPLVNDAVRYLLDSYDEDAGVWIVAPPEANDAPHAPWMGYGENVKRQWHGFSANPKAAIVASLLHYSALVPNDWLSEALDSLCRYLVSRESSLDGYESGAIGQLLDKESLPRDKFAQLIEIAGSRLCVPARPDSPIMSQFTDGEIDQDLNALVTSQCPDGTWPVAWSWGDAHPEAWAAAEVEWKGILIVAHMKKLAAFGRLE